MIVGYTTGVFDLFHIGHLNLLKCAKGLCDKLIVGVTTDELMLECKGRKPTIPFEERIEIIRNIRFVDAVLVQKNMDKLSIWKKIKFDFLFVGDDWYDTAKWRQYEKDFEPVRVKIIYLPYTKRTSSTLINNRLRRR